METRAKGKRPQAHKKITYEQETWFCLRFGKFWIHVSVLCNIILNVFTFLIHAYYFSIHDRVVCYFKKKLHLFFSFVRYYFTCVFKCFIYAYYFSIYDCNTFGGILIPYTSSSKLIMSSSQWVYKIKYQDLMTYKKTIAINNSARSNFGLSWQGHC